MEEVSALLFSSCCYPVKAIQTRVCARVNHPFPSAEKQQPQQGGDCTETSSHVQGQTLNPQASPWKKH